MGQINTTELFKYWRKRIFISLWLTYATFYFCRVNISIAIPGIMEEFGISKTAMGAILTCFFLTYAIGQFLNGQLGNRFSARKFITFGIFASAILNAVFGFTSGVFMAMMLIWGLNGFFQSMGWSPSVKTIANWFPLKMRGRISGAYGSSYQMGNAGSWALSGLIVGLLGWRWCFWIPAGIFVISGIHWYIRGRDAPETVGLPSIEEESGEASPTGPVIKENEHLGFVYTLKAVLSNPKIWCVVFTLFCLNIVRYGFMTWIPTYIFEVEKASISHAAYKALAIPIAGSIGALFTGWASDKFFQSRRAPMVVIMLILLAILTWAYPKIPVDRGMWGLVCLLLVGFAIYGPHVLVCATMCMDYATRRAAASAAGLVDCFGYFGAALAGIGSGWMVDHYGWNAAFNFWIVGIVIGIILMIPLWSYKPT